MIKDGVHHWPVRVYFEDTDAGGIVYHASYLRFAERGRTEALRDLGAPHQEMLEQHGRFFVVRRIKVDYLHPARADAALIVATRLRRSQASTVLLEQRIVAAADAAGTVHAVLEVLLVCVAATTLRPARVPERWREAMARLRGPDETGRNEETSVG